MPASSNYETARTRHWRATALQKEDRRTLDNIEQFGCTVVNVAAREQRMSWSYSIGVYDTCGQPEIIAVGLKSDVAHYLVDEAANLLRGGTDLLRGRHADLLGTVECEFRPVDPKWVKHLMGWAEWYYEHEDFPVLQAIYPDLENRFPGEDGFNEYFTQPLLQPGAPVTLVEQDFWASNDKESSLFDWPFEDRPHTQVFISEPVHVGTETVTYVAHEENGDWQMLGDSMSEGNPPLVVCFHHLIDADASLKELSDLPRGWWAERATSIDPWIRQELEEDRHEEVTS